MQPPRLFFVEVRPVNPLYRMNPHPYTFVEHSYMGPNARSSGSIPGPRELLPRHFYYPASGLFLIENRLVSAGGSAWGRRFWLDAFKFKTADVVLSLKVEIIEDRAYIKMRHTARHARTRHDVPCSWESSASLFHNGVLLIVMLRRIQRAVLRHLHRLAAPRRLAVAMGLDARLGALSLISMLPPDLFGSAVVPLLNRVM